MSLRTPTKTAGGLGSAKTGVHHWWMQRLSAVALIVLVLWFAISLVGIVGKDHATVAAWIASPSVAVTLVLLLAGLFYHAALGTQVVWEDYTQGAIRMVGIIVTKFICLVLAVTGIFSVLRIAFSPLA